MENIVDIICGKHFQDAPDNEMINDIKNFIADKLYSEYNDYRMNIETIIQNKINAFPITLPNGKVGEAYSQKISISDPDIIEFWIEGYEPIGLQVSTAINVVEDETNQVINISEEDHNVIIKGNNETPLTITGVPVVAGDFDLTIKFVYKSWIKGRPILERKFKLAINPDPRSLWKNIPTDKNVVFYKPDECSEYVTVPANEKGPQKDVVAASKRGRSHAHEGKPRDDHFQLYHNDENGWYIIAVADGAGSAKYSRQGSKIACEVALENCKDILLSPEALEAEIITYNNAGEGATNKKLSDSIYNIVGGSAYKAYKAIDEASKANENTQIRDFSTTLMLAICKKFEFGWFIASFWVGDGAMCIYDKDRQYFKLLGVPDGGEFAGQTRFLTMKEIFTPESIMSRLRYSIEQDFTALMLMTDGISDPYFETDANLNKIEKWNELWDSITKDVELTDDNSESQYHLLKWMDFWSPGNHDDRTLAILY